ncbi:MAG: sugar phosphate isomerase/epimerase [Verrucomicrobiales bacterium]|nr:sugar phosphate isomerase/epimerase [Verrucomicrobiales bacterium]
MTGALGLTLTPWQELLSVTEPYKREQSRLLLGVAAYSFRNHFAFMKGAANKGYVEGSRQLDMADFIRYSAGQGVDSVELTSYFFSPETDDAYLAHCREVAHVNGVGIAGTAVGNNFSYPKDTPEREKEMAYVKDWVDKASILGAPHVRVFAGRHPKGVNADEAEQNAIEALKESGEYAATKGVFLGIENHDSVSTADRLLRIVTAVDNPFVGVNLDSGNFIADDVYAEMEASAPYAINVQLKTEIKGANGKEPADLERVIGILRNTGYAGHVILEYEEQDDPFVHVPEVLAKLRGYIDA